MFANSKPNMEVQPDNLEIEDLFIGRDVMFLRQKIRSDMRCLSLWF
jgi:hypothetical protein